MKIAFAHDHRFIQNSEGIVFTPGKLPYKTWQRYLDVFDNLTVIGRHTLLPQIDATSGISISSGPNVDFAFVPSLSNPIAELRFKRTADNIISDVLSSVDGLIARLPSQIGLAAVRVAERLGKPWMLEVVGCPWDSAIHYMGWKVAPLAPFWRSSMRPVVKRAPFVIYVTNNFLQDRYPTQGIAVACSNVEIPEPDDNILQMRLERIRTPKSVLKLGMIASLGPRYKGIKTALEALKYINNSNLRLHILGDGDPAPWKRIAQRLNITHQVVFDGARHAGTAVQQWLDNIDIYLQPSYAEGLPRALIEAMSRGCPAFGSTAGGIPELLPSSCLHTPKNARQLGEQVRAVLDEPELLSKLAVQNFFTSKQYSHSRLMDIRRGLYRRFADHITTFHGLY
jgi:glycosyltransferase involved in cell wall biosynthesis